MSALETIRISQRGKDQLAWLKRWTKIKTWNVVCRWAFCASLAETSAPPSARIPSDSSVEMSWRTFAGEFGDVYMALLRERCHRDGVGTDDATLLEQLRLHIHRGLGYLAADRSIRSIEGLLARVEAG